jgi:hypothetical protein
VVAGCAAGTPAGTGSGGASSAAPVAGGGALGTAVQPGDDLCKLLGPGDFTAAGVPGAGGPSENNQPPEAYYCVYRGASSATGGIEMDVFLAADAAEAEATFPDLFGEFDSSDDTPVTVPGADEAQLSLPPEGSDDPALIGVRKGPLTIGIGVGSVEAGKAQQVGEQLKALAALAVARATAIGT